MLEFSEKDLMLACKMHELGIDHEPEPGDYYYDVSGIVGRPTPFQPGVFLVSDVADFSRADAGEGALFAELCWLPTWESGCAWMRGRGVPIKHVYYTVKEGVMFYGEQERELLYGEMIRILELDLLKDAAEEDPARQ